MFIQLMPIVVLVLVSVLSQMMVSTPPYSLYSRPYVIIPYNACLILQYNLCFRSCAIMPYDTCLTTLYKLYFRQYVITLYKWGYIFWVAFMQLMECLTFF